ncbi:MAG TPA: tRNA pseudouridine(38-40) synthase TruA [Acidimicrobiales bacterium]|nr:tRNA pseudouridine(38-40) synthase TruA [Acidimicrobiales bacterium]
MTDGAVVRVRMTVAYDGRGFSGIAPQPNAVTVGGVLAAALQRALRMPEPPELAVAGRTDAGVHAWGQVVTFDAPAAGLDLARLQRSVNSQLAPRVVAREVACAPPGFHARRSALSRRYRYTVLNRPVPDPFLAATAWHVAEPLDLPALRLACDPLIGEHDFTSFCRAPKGVEGYSLVRRVTDARWVAAGDGVLRFEIEANSFCQQMVRAVVGTMVAMGAGRRKAGEMRSILLRRERAAAERVAPASGLCLWAVSYPAAADGCA